MVEEDQWQIAGARSRRRPRSNTVKGNVAKARDGGSIADTRTSTVVSGKAKWSGFSYVRSKAHLHQKSLSLADLVDNEIKRLLQLKKCLYQTPLWKELVDSLNFLLPKLGLAVLTATNDEVLDSSHRQTSPKNQDSSPIHSDTRYDHVTLRRARDNNGADIQESCGSKLKRMPVDTGAPQALQELVCYGVGNFSDNIKSRYQMALALCLRDLLFPSRLRNEDRERADSRSADSSPANLECNQHANRHPYDSDEEASNLCSSDPQGLQTTPHLNSGKGFLFFDPIMGDVEAAVLARLGCEVMKVNEIGKRCCTGRLSDTSTACCPTLFFMPHCPEVLYTNVLWANWSSKALGATLILGNQMSAYVERQISQDVQKDPRNAILQAQPLLTELSLSRSTRSDTQRGRGHVDRLPHLVTAFNDLTLTCSLPHQRASEQGQDVLQKRPQETLPPK